MGQILINFLVKIFDQFLVDFLTKTFMVKFSIIFLHFLISLGQILSIFRSTFVKILIKKIFGQFLDKFFRKALLRHQMTLTSSTIRIFQKKLNYFQKFKKFLFKKHIFSQFYFFFILVQIISPF